MGSGVPASTTWTPGQRSLATMRRYVLNFTQTPDDTDNQSVVDDAINASIDHLNTRNWKKILGVQDITLVADDDDYSLDADFRDPRIAELLNSSGKRVKPVGYLPFKSFYTENANSQESGSPSIYTIRYDQREALLNSAPTAAFIATYPTLRLRHHRRLAHLTQASSTLDVAPEFWSYLGWQARWEWAMVRGDLPRARIAEREAVRRWEELKMDDCDTMTDWYEYA